MNVFVPVMAGSVAVDSLVKGGLMERWVCAVCDIGPCLDGAAAWFKYQMDDEDYCSGLARERELEVGKRDRDPAMPARGWSLL